MSADLQSNLFGYAVVTMIVFVAAVAVLLSDGSRGYRDLTDRERVWMGRIGLAAPIWPITILVLVGCVIGWMFRVLINATKGRS